MSIQMNTKTITVSDNQTIRVSIKPGAPNSVPLLLCTGIGASLELLFPFVEAMHIAQPDLEIITFDYPGVAGSSTPLFPYRFSGLCRTISEMLDFLNYGQVFVLGLSWGGFTSQEFAYQYPNRCKKLILAATCAGVTAIPPSMKVLSLMSSPKRYTDPDYAASIAADIYGGHFRGNKELATEHALRMSQSKGEFKHSQLGYAYQQGALMWWSSLWYLHSIKQPTLILAGDDDPLIDLRNMNVLAKLIPNSEMHVFEGEGHLFLLTSLEEVVPIVTKFLENK